MVYSTLAYILTNPVALERVRHEVDEFCQGLDVGKINAVDGQGFAEDFGQLMKAALKDGKLHVQLANLESCMMETLRLCSGFNPFRDVTKDISVTLNGGETFNFRKGDTIYFVNTLAHWHPELFPSPETFVFDRFLPRSAAVGKPDSAFDDNGQPVFKKDGKVVSLQKAFTAFGFSQHMCPGRHFIYLETRVFMVLWLRYFDSRIAIPGPNGSLKIATCQADLPKISMERYMSAGILHPEHYNAVLQFKPRVLAA
jgi:cytochrome P450